MKLASFVTLASLAVCSIAQSINIGYPYDNKQIKPGQHLTVQVNRPTTFASSKEVALVISLVECPKNGHCPNPADITIGTILYLGPFDPKLPTSTTTPDQEPQQNFAVIVPGSLTPGRTAQLVVTHLALISDSLQVSDSPLIEVRNVTLEVVPDS